VPCGIRHSAVLTESGNGSALAAAVPLTTDNGSVSWSSGRLGSSSGSADGGKR
jgi:hypothetical protein